MDTRISKMTKDLPRQAADFQGLNAPLHGANSASHDVENSIRDELLHHFQHHAPPSVMIFNVLLGLLPGFVMWPFASHSLIAFWFVCHAAIGLSNHFIYRSFRKQHLQETTVINNTGWYRAFCFGALVNGASWGVICSLLYTPDALLQSFFVILIAAGVSSGITTIQVSLRAGFMLFIIPSLLIPAVAIPLQHGNDSLFVAFLLIVYFGFLTHAGFGNRRMVIETIRLKFEKDQLLEQIQGSERYFRALIENASDLVIVINISGRIIFQSPSSNTVLGYRPEELEGLNLYDFIHVNDVDDFKKTIHYLEEHKQETKGGETRWLHRDGRWLILEGNGKIMDIDNSLVVINARDVTDRRTIEDQLRQEKIKAETANQAKSLFLANMSHEIRTPMHAILAMADVLNESKLSTQQSRHVSAFKEAGEHLLSLLNDLLDFSRIETGELNLSNAPFHLPQLIEAIFDLMWGQAKNKHIQLNYDMDPSIRPWHLGDPQRIRQIIVNLTNNAIKFTNEGEVLIRVSQRNSHPDNDRILIEVRDTGEGIEPENIGIIFDSFAQADKSISERFGGTGLGLAICKRLVEAMAGTLWVESIKGKGSSFYCELPLPSTDEPSELIDRRERDSAITAAKLPPVSILVADDSAMNRMVIEEYLRYTPCQTEFAFNGQEAVEKCALFNYDIILMDLRMPVMDGLAATRLIRQREQELSLSVTPIIALTAGVMSGDKESSFAAGCSDFLAKPVGKEELTRCLFKYLNKHGREEVKEGSF